MTKEDILSMAQQAGFSLEQGFLLRVTGIDEDLERFAALVAASELRRVNQENEELRQGLARLAALYGKVANNRDELFESVIQNKLKEKAWKHNGARGEK